MSYYNYHAKIKEKILSGKLDYYKIVDSWNDISPAMVLYFKDGKTYPIRQHKWDEYLNLLSNLK